MSEEKSDTTQAKPKGKAIPFKVNVRRNAGKLPEALIMLSGNSGQFLVTTTIADADDSETDVIRDAVMRAADHLEATAAGMRAFAKTKGG